MGGAQVRFKADEGDPIARDSTCKASNAENIGGQAPPPPQPGVLFRIASSNCGLPTAANQARGSSKMTRGGERWHPENETRAPF